MIDRIIFALWFFLPAGIANVSPVIGKGLPIIKKLNYPIDMGIKWRSKPILGRNKTWRGLIAAVIAALVVIAMQRYCFYHSHWLQHLMSSTIDYRSGKVWFLGALLGLGAILGDAIESLIKRRIGIKSGKSWFPFDQIDYIVGGCLFAAIVVRLSIENYLIVLVVWFVIHLITNYLGYLTGINSDPI